MISPSTASSDRLRARATQLRSLARRLHGLRIVDCYRSAGYDTWVGPSPQRCDDALRTYPMTLRAEVDSLSVEARRLERLADEIDARASLVGPH